MKKYYRRFLLWLFKGHIRSYLVASVISKEEMEMAQSPRQYTQYVVEKLGVRIAEKMMQDGSIIIERRNMGGGMEEFRARLYVLWSFGKRKDI